MDGRGYSHIFSLKDTLTLAPTLQLPDFTQEFVAMGLGRFFIMEQLPLLASACPSHFTTPNFRCTNESSLDWSLQPGTSGHIYGGASLWYALTITS